MSFIGCTLGASVSVTYFSEVQHDYLQYSRAKYFTAALLTLQTLKPSIRRDDRPPLSEQSRSIAEQNSET